MMSDLVVISLHEKGFWQADMFRDASDLAPSEMEAIGLAPDSFFTLKRGASRHLAERRAREVWPDAKIVLDENFDAAVKAQGAA